MSQNPLSTSREPSPASAEHREDMLPEEIALQLRKLAHDLSNALEIIVQTSYLLSTVPLNDTAKEWLGMLESGVNKSLEINNELRSYIRSHAC